MNEPPLKNDLQLTNYLLALMFLFLFGLFASGCAQTPSLQSAFIPQKPPPTATPFQPLPPTPYIPPPPPPTATPAPTQSPFAVWIDPLLAPFIHAHLNLPDEFRMVNNFNSATYHVSINNQKPITHWIFTLVAPFPTLTDDVTFDTVQQVWQGKARFTTEVDILLVAPETLSLFSAVWGEPDPAYVQTTPSTNLLQQAWEKHAWSIIPFEQLEPRWKTISINGINPLFHNLDPETYPLAIPIAINTRQGKTQPNAHTWLTSNRVDENITILALTGVTALVRATAWSMEQYGITYPADEIKDILSSADITHISNEVTFTPACPYPNPVQEDLIFCSDDRYIALLDKIGTDIVELTGDHLNDWGDAAFIHTLELYHQRGWDVYGGGENIAEARHPLIIENHGNRLGFLGCNAKGTGFAHASETTPGAAPCDFPLLSKQINQLAQEGILPIVTLQHFEYYTYTPMPNQIRDAKLLADAGAVIISGSQAHQPQAFAFHEGSFIHYGLGNLFFDQFGVSEATKQSFIDLHIIYNGKHINTVLITLQFVDYAKPRLSTSLERLRLLSAVFDASGW